MLLPAITEFSIPSASARYAECARAMKIVPSTATDSQALDGVFELFAQRDRWISLTRHLSPPALMTELIALNTDLSVPTPKKYGISREKYESVMQTMADQALASGSPGNNPRVPTQEEIVELYKRVWVE
jgi:alcohol dehydrogenase class IV